MISRGEAAHSRANLSDNHFGGLASDSRNGVEPLDDFCKRGAVSLNLSVKAGHRLIQTVNLAQQLGAVVYLERADNSAT
jgi:hypothetical protein